MTPPAACSARPAASVQHSMRSVFQSADPFSGHRDRRSVRRTHGACLSLLTYELVNRHFLFADFDLFADRAFLPWTGHDAQPLATPPTDLRALAGAGIIPSAFILPLK